MNDETDIAFIAYLQGYEAGRDVIKVERDKYKAEMETLEIKVAELDQAYRICAVDWKHEQSEANRYKAERDELIAAINKIEHRRRVAAEAIALEIEMISDFELSDFNNIESCRTNLMQIHEAAMKLKSIIKEAGE